MKKINCAIYIRVSTKEQNPENQKEKLISYCRDNDYYLYKTYIDYGESGKKASRPAFNDMLRDMRSRKFNTILIWKLDRIGRSLQNLIVLLKEMEKKKIDLICLTQKIDTTHAAGKLMFHLIGAFAEFESTLISERTKLGMERAKQEGKKIGRPKKDKAIYNKFCMVSGCRVKIENNRQLCHKHKKYSKLISK